MKKVEEHIPTSVFDTEKHDQEMRATYPEGDALKPAFLYVERGPGAGQLVQLKPGPLVIGRASVSDLRLQHPSISRRHAQFKRIGEQFFVKDLGSQNGTFVNKDKIETEIEVFPGDLIAMGNALLKLRGPLAKGEALPSSSGKPSKMKAPKTSLKTAVVSRHHTTTTRTPSSNVVKVAIFAGAIGFGLAGVMAFAFMKNAGGPAPSARERALADKAKPSSAGSGGDIGISMDEVKVKQNKQIDDAISRKMQEKQAAAAKAAAAAPKETEDSPAETSGSDDRKPRPVVVAKASTGSKKSAGADDEEAPAAKSAAPSAKRTAILSAYEKGNAEGSLESAKKANDRDLTSKLQDFISVYGAAEEAVTANNGGAAIKNFEKALKLDEQLSSGWGVYGGKIRKQLGNLYTLVGLQHVKNDNLDNAKLAFKEALKNDPDNERAKSQLAKLGGGEEKKVARSAPAASDDEEEKPAPKKKAAAKKPAAEPKSRSQAIDDAFGD